MKHQQAFRHLAVYMTSISPSSRGATPTRRTQHRLSLAERRALRHGLDKKMDNHQSISAWSSPVLSARNRRKDQTLTTRTDCWLPIFLSRSSRSALLSASDSRYCVLRVGFAPSLRVILKSYRPRDGGTPVAPCRCFKNSKCTVSLCVSLSVSNFRCVSLSSWLSKKRKLHNSS